MKRVTARKHLGDDRQSWAIFVDGRPYVTGLTKREVPYYRKQASREEGSERVTDKTPEERTLQVLGKAVHPGAVKRLHELFPTAQVRVQHREDEVPRGTFKMDGPRTLGRRSTLVTIQYKSHDYPFALGESRCHPEDNYDRRRGVHDAFHRAFDRAREHHALTHGS